MTAPADAAADAALAAAASDPAPAAYGASIGGGWEGWLQRLLQIQLLQQLLQIQFYQRRGRQDAAAALDTAPVTDGDTMEGGGQIQLPQQLLQI